MRQQISDYLNSLKDAFTELRFKVLPWIVKQIDKRNSHCITKLLSILMTVLGKRIICLLLHPNKTTTQYTPHSFAKKFSQVVFYSDDDIISGSHYIYSSFSFQQRVFNIPVLPCSWFYKILKILCRNWKVTELT